MTNRYLIVIDPATRVAELDAFNFIVRHSPVPTTYHLPALFGSSSLPQNEWECIAGVMVLGSGASVHESLAWQDELRCWLNVLISQPIVPPILGVCYGHQLIAEMLGGKVTFLFDDQAKLKGFREIKFETNRWTERPCGEVCVSHREVVSQLPDTLRCIASSSTAAIEAFEHVSLPIWGIQAHPEATQEFLRNQEISLPTSAAHPFSFGHNLVKDFLGIVSMEK